MIRLFKHYVPYAVLLLAAIDCALLLLAAEAGWVVRLWQVAGDGGDTGSRLPHMLAFAAAIQTAMVAVGVYGVQALQSMRFATARLMVAMALGVLFLSLIFFLFPPVAFWRSSLLYATWFALIAMVATRALLRTTLSGERFKRRVLVLGSGARAARIEALANQRGSGLKVVGFVAMNDGPSAVPGAVNRADLASLPRHLLALGAGEVVLALEERRNALPLGDLLKIKTTGVEVHDFSSFLERETGRVDLDSLIAWLIFSDGFSAGRRLSSWGKRLFDVTASLLLLLVALPLILITAIAVKLESRGPAFYRQRRVGLYGEAFNVIKLRSMRTDAEVGGKAVWAQKDDPRVTRIGRFIRKVRIDELPQVWSVLKGEMSFVGPRPERPQFVADLEERLPYYAERHVVKPGITGWAQINYPYGASIEDAREKLEFDLYYAKNYTPFLDLLILLQTARVVLWPEGGALMPALLVLVSHLAAAALYGVLALHQLRHWRADERHRPLIAAFAVMAGWALALGLLPAEALVVQLGESGRNLAFLAFMYGIMREAAAEGEERQRAVQAVYAAVAAAVGVQIAVGGVMAQFRDLPLAFQALVAASQLLGLIVAAGALILVHNLYGQAAPGSRAALRLPMIALAAMWAFDLHLYTVAYFKEGADLAALRGLIFALLAPLFALGVRRGPRWTIQLSRAATFQSVSLIAILFYLVAMMSAARLAAALGGEWGRASGLGLIALMSAAALLILPSGKARAWLRVFLAKHVFEHRYDYRREWRRFTDTVGRERGDGAPLEERIIKGLADIAEAPAGLLLLTDPHYRLTLAARWNSAAELPPCGEGAERLLRFAETQAHVLDFAVLRGGALRHGEESFVVPDWLTALGSAWAGVPLIHSGRLIGLVILDQPAFRRPLDWEDFDLFRTAGIQAASYLAEAKSQQALSDARRFDEFNRRFAFILHDIKNLVSQLSLVTRNAERHADNPEFRADMIATLQSSVRKMNELLLRLTPDAARPFEPPRPVALGPLLEGVAAAKRRAHPVRVEGDPSLAALADPAGLEQALSHLVQNAIDASPPDAPVRIRYFESGGDSAIEIANSGPGMASDFVATRLFQPFASTKAEGFGIGAYEARAVVLAMGGRLEVDSAEGRGTCFTIFLPGAELAPAPIIERMRA